MITEYVEDRIASRVNLNIEASGGGKKWFEGNKRILTIGGRTNAIHKAPFVIIVVCSWWHTLK